MDINIIFSILFKDGYLYFDGKVIDGGNVKMMFNTRDDFSGDMINLEIDYKGNMLTCKSNGIMFMCNQKSFENLYLRLIKGVETAEL